MLYQLSYFRVLTGANVGSFTISSKHFSRFLLKKAVYRPKSFFSASSTAVKLKPFETSSIKAVILSLHKLPMLPACV